MLPRRSTPRRDYPDIDYCPHCYNAKGPERTRERAEALTDPAILEMYGGGEFPLLYTEFAENGNYLEPQEISVRHGVCGDPEQVRWFVRLFCVVHMLFRPCLVLRYTSVLHPFSCFTGSSFSVVLGFSRCLFYIALLHWFLCCAVPSVFFFVVSLVHQSRVISINASTLYLIMPRLHFDTGG